MQPAKDADHLTIYSDATYPVGPNTAGEISYVHVAPLSPLAITIIVVACLAVITFLGCYVYPLIRRYQRARVATRHIKRPILGSIRSFLGLRPQTPPPITPQLFARYGGLGMRIARPPPALSRFREPSLSPSLSPSLWSSPSSSSSSSSSASSSSSSSPSPMEKLPKYSPSANPEVIIAPISTNILGQAVESRTTPKKGGGHFDGTPEMRKSE
ncbi:hypothetical protein B0F90DRAFT_689280 [Multifurca ochricompacta]|uniref:Uncharacterized protein n=1 Tax=Multifurca ochricompacta TaxID=376703 RepID=A0AAD4M1K3_9AGAM|nr:hypothetical protein B0F90DRAFT_689280 [Multifurca ochricompacta]